MGDANPIYTLGDYSKPSHEGYRYTIELPEGNNVNRGLRKLSAEKAWATIEELARYEDEGWNDPIILEEEILDYENPDLEQLLGVMKGKVDELMKNAISLKRRNVMVMASHVIGDAVMKALENQLLSVSLLICLGKHDYVERIPSAINWLDRLPAGSISTWDDLTTRCLVQFFPPERTAKLQNDILMFQQHQGKSLYDAWNRFKDLLLKVPHHGLDLWLQVQIFCGHVNYTTQMAINDATGGRLRKLRPKEAGKTIEDLAQYEEE
ncbi:zinc finger, CCHC-type containing protein [Tanacetum coccineum]